MTTADQDWGKRVDDMAERLAKKMRDGEKFLEEYRKAKKDVENKKKD